MDTYRINAKKKNLELELETQEEYKNFDWKTYVENYPDLKKIVYKFDAWKHWVNNGQKENRVTYDLHQKRKECFQDLYKNKELSLLIHNEKESLQDLCKDEFLIYNKVVNIIFKTNYINYGTHYFGWKGVIQSLLVFLEIKIYENHIKLKQPILFDEWIEKLFLWGNTKNNEKYLKEIQNKNKNNKIITFIHNPPYDNLDETDVNIDKKVMFNKKLLNKNLFHILNENNMSEKIEYMYTLSNSHKEYIYTHYPIYKNKLLSIHHPIEMFQTDKNKYFDFHFFMISKRIVHIGWWLRNFKTFIDLELPSYIQKNILVKSDFKKKWDKMSLHYDLHNIQILHDLTNIEYEEIFTNSCIFIDLEDTVANNVILECIRFNTPVITKRLPSAVEYLGENYPLFFTEKEELLKFQDSTIFLKAILHANKYLSNMNKTHIQLETFNNKILYDLNKLSKNNDNMLSWFCLIDDYYINTEIIHNFISNFLNQTNCSQLKLKFIFKNTADETNASLKSIMLLQSIIFNYKEKHPNISYINIQVENDYEDFLNIAVENTDTTFLTIANIKDIYDKDYSAICINYLVENPTSDIVYSNFEILCSICKSNPVCRCISYPKKNDLEKILYKKDTLLFKKNLSEISFSNTKMVWRKNIHSIVNYFQSMPEEKLIFSFFWEKCIIYHLNIYCATDKILLYLNN